MGAKVCTMQRWQSCLLCLFICIRQRMYSQSSILRGLFLYAACFTCHTYADDTQVYLSIPACHHIDAKERLASCIEQIRDWMADNHLKLNQEKTQIIWLGSRQQLKKSSAQALTLPNTTVQFSTAVMALALYWIISLPWPTTLLHFAVPFCGHHLSIYNC